MLAEFKNDIEKKTFFSRFFGPKDPSAPLRGEVGIESEIL